MNNLVDSPRQPSWLIISVHFIMLTLISIFAFSRNSALLLLGNDGPTGYSLANEQLSFFGISPHLHSNLLEGLGNISLPYNQSVQPGYWFGAFVHDGTVSLALLYTWFALLLFASVLLIGWNYHFSRRTSITAAWLITILAFPYFETIRIYNITASMPNFVDIIFIFTLMDIGIQRIGSGSWAKTFCYGAVTLLGLIISLVCCPALLILVIPMLSVTTLFSLVTAKSRSELLRRIVVLITILIIAACAGWIEYFAGMLLYAVGVFFNDEMHAAYVNTATFTFASILFHGKINGITLGPWLFCTSMLGSIYAILKASKHRMLAITVLLTQFFVLATGVISAVFHPVKLASISIIYFEVVLFPFYAFFSVYLIAQFIKLTPGIIKRLDAITPFLVVTVMAICLLNYQPNKRARNGFAIPAVSTPITAILENEIALQIDKPFAGRVATVIPGMNVREQFQYASNISITSGNDHQSTGLWLKHIPTLHEYSQSLTPAFYRIYRRHLSDGTDNSDRNLSSFNKINLKILKLLGVSFILSTDSTIQHTTQRAKLVADASNPALYLYELKGANTSGISAQHIINANDLRDAEDIMAARKFDIHDAVVVHAADKIKSSFVAATDSRLSIIKGGFRLQSTSKSKTLLILPIEFSHCLSVTPLTGKIPEIIRVDVALTGVLFDRAVDVKLDNTTGPFANPRCRLNNYREFAQLWKK